MSNAGLLANADRSSGYGVGNLIFETSRRHRAHSTLSVLADEVLAGIARSTGHTGYIAIRDGTDILGLRMRPGSKPLRVVTSPGDRLPGILLVERPRAAGAPRRRCRESVLRCAAAAAVAQRTADDRRSFSRADGGVARRAGRRQPTRLCPG